MAKLKCPECGSENFICRIVNVGICTIETREDGKNQFNIIRQGEETVSTLKCCANRDCKKHVEGLQTEDLVEGIPCKKCGKMHRVEDVNENGVCRMCAAMERDDIKNASKEDLIRMILSLERNNTGVSHSVETIEKKITAAESVQEKINTEAEAKKAAILEKAATLGAENADESNPSPDLVDKPKRKPRSKNATKDAEAEPVPTPMEEAPIETVTSPAEQINMEAPFPEVITGVAPGINPPEPTEGFNMFDNQESPVDPGAF